MGSSLIMKQFYKTKLEYCDKTKLTCIQKGCS